MDLMEERRLSSHAEAAQVLRKAGYSQERIQEVLRELPDPIDIDSERNVETFFKHGITYARLMDQMGGSP